MKLPKNKTKWYAVFSDSQGNLQNYPTGPTDSFAPLLFASAEARDEFMAIYGPLADVHPATVELSVVVHRREKQVA